MKYILILILPFLLSGCLYLNERGVDTRYYNDCKEYYDSMGIYHKSCDKNLIEYQDVKDEVRDISEKTKELISSDEPKQDKR